jgi:hypothetical protein
MQRTMVVEVLQHNCSPLAYASLLDNITASPALR